MVPEEPLKKKRFFKLDEIIEASDLIVSSAVEEQRNEQARLQPEEVEVIERPNQEILSYFGNSNHVNS